MHHNGNKITDDLTANKFAIQREVRQQDTICVLGHKRFLFSTSFEELQDMLREWKAISEEIYLFMNIEKTRIMTPGKIVVKVRTDLFKTLQG